MPSFDRNTRPETFVPLIHDVSDDFVPSNARPSSDAASVHQRHELDKCRKCYRARIRAKGKGKRIYIAPLLQHLTLKALGYELQSFTCKQHHTCLYLVRV